MTTISDLIQNPTEVEITFKELKVNGNTATYYYYDALNPMKNELGEPIVLNAYYNDAGETVYNYLYEYVAIPVSIYLDDGVTERDISVVEADAAYAAILEFQKRYLEKAMEEYVIPDEIILDGNLYLF